MGGIYPSTPGAVDSSFPPQHFQTCACWPRKTARQRHKVLEARNHQRVGKLSLKGAGNLQGGLKGYRWTSTVSSRGGWMEIVGQPNFFPSHEPFKVITGICPFPSFLPSSLPSLLFSSLLFSSLLFSIADIQCYISFRYNIMIPQLYRLCHANIAPPFITVQGHYETIDRIPYAVPFIL